MKQTCLQTLRDVDLWNSARWAATAYIIDLEGRKPPCLGLVFTDIEAGKRIFAGWRECLGDVDLYGELRISIVEGDVLGEDPGYTVHVSSDPLNALQRADANGMHLDINPAFIVGRSNRMTPAPGRSHLALFKEEYRKHKRYLLLPISREGVPDIENSIWKTELHLRQASDIRAGDLESVVFPAHYFVGNGTIH